MSKHNTHIAQHVTTSRKHNGGMLFRSKNHLTENHGPTVLHHEVAICYMRGVSHDMIRDYFKIL